MSSARAWSIIAADAVASTVVIHGEGSCEHYNISTTTVNARFAHGMRKQRPRAVCHEGHHSRIGLVTFRCLPEVQPRSNRPRLVFLANVSHFSDEKTSIGLAGPHLVSRTARRWESSAVSSTRSGCWAAFSLLCRRGRTSPCR